MSTDNSQTNAAVTLAALSVETVIGFGSKAGGLAGCVVQPAVWAATGTGPDAGDAVIYGAGVAGVFAGAILAVPAIITGVVKAAVDDHVATLAAEAAADEPSWARKTIKPVGDYSFGASDNAITASTIASKGGVTWQHPNGVWVYISDAKGLLVPDYRPKKYKTLYGPILPLQVSGDRVKWKEYY